MPTLPPSDLKDVCLSFRLRESVAEQRAALWALGKKQQNEALYATLRHEFQRWQFDISTSGLATVCVRCSWQQMQDAFGTRVLRVPVPERIRSLLDYEYVLAEGGQLPIGERIAQLVDHIAIQRPYAYANSAAVLPPPALPAGHPFRLSVLDDVPRRLRADKVLAAGKSGSGVKVCAIDTGFQLGHVFFTQLPLQGPQVMLAGLASNEELDDWGHGTGVCANLLSVAPGVEFVGVKLNNESMKELNASLLEGFHTAMAFNPAVISVSMLSLEDYGPDAVKLSNADDHVAAEIRAIAGKVVVVVGAGNGEFGFPSQMPEVIAAGGVFSSDDENGAETLQASNMASAFKSGLFPGRCVPDVCGLVGMQPRGEYITLPVEFGSHWDKESQGYDGTTADDGWAVFSGTSSAAPQVAAVCALMLQANPSLKPQEIKKLLCDSARPVTQGETNSLTGGLVATTQDHVATGAGLVDAFAACNAALEAAGQATLAP